MTLFLHFYQLDFFCHCHQTPPQLKVPRFQRWAELVFELANKGLYIFSVDYF